jgi:hypothetical protein
VGWEDKCFTKVRYTVKEYFLTYLAENGDDPNKLTPPQSILVTK